MNQNVRFLQEPAQAVAAVGGIKVQRDAPLAGIEEKEQPAVFGIDNVVAERPAPPRHVAGGRLDLDYVGAEVGEYPRRKSRRHSLAAFDYRDTCQRAMTARGIGQSVRFEIVFALGFDRCSRCTRRRALKSSHYAGDCKP